MLCQSPFPAYTNTGWNLAVLKWAGQWNKKTQVLQWCVMVQEISVSSHPKLSLSMGQAQMESNEYQSKLMLYVAS